jgi:hypothetical protein
MGYHMLMTTDGYTIETQFSNVHGLTLECAANWFRRCNAEGQFAMVARDSDGATLVGCHGFYLPPGVTAPELTETERTALGC